jgi:photosystem II stability/assembly factor-like uncharacterized protein
MVRSMGLLGLALVVAASPIARAAGTLSAQTTGAAKGIMLTGAADETHAFALGAKDDGQGNSQMMSLLTSDGGATWDMTPAQGLTAGAMLILNDAICPSAGKCLALASSIDMSGGGFPVIQNNLISSADGGKTWAWPAKTQLKSWSFSRIDVVTEQDIWLSSGANVIVHSTDGGKTFQWKVPQVGDKKYMAIVETAFLSATTGYVLNAKAETTDAGVETISPEGALLKTTDGGATWTALFTDKTEAYGRLEMASEQVGWLAGHTAAGPFLRKTTDGGQTWDDVAIPTPVASVPALTSIDGLWMFNAQDGLLVANYKISQEQWAHVIFEIRGGALAEMTSDPVNNAGSMYGLSCTATGTCWMGGSTGTILKYEDTTVAPPSDTTTGGDVAGSDVANDVLGNDGYVPQDLNGYWDTSSTGGKSGCVAGSVPGAATAIPALLGLLLLSATRLRRRD